MMIGVVGPVVFGIGTVFGITVPPGTTWLGDTVVPGAVTAFGLAFGKTVWPELTEVPVFGTTVVPVVLPVPELFGITVELGPVVFGATVALGPAVLGATVELGPVRTLVLALVGFCVLAEPLSGAPVLGIVVLGTEPICRACARQAGCSAAVNIMQLVPGGNVTV